MDAVKLIEANRHALAQARGAQNILAEAWQAQALVEAVGVHLTQETGLGVQAASFALSEAGGRACAALYQSARHAGEARAGSLSRMADPVAALRALRRLLQEAQVALVTVACSLEEESAYWSCVDGLDAADECRDRLADLLHALGEGRLVGPGAPGPAERPAEQREEQP